MSVPKLIIAPFRGIGRLLAPTDVSVYEADPVAASMLIEERRQTRLARSAIMTCVVMLAIFVGWATLTPVHEVVSGQGEVLPGGLVTKVQHLEGGIVDRVMVKPGERVSAGQVLVTLDTTGSRAELEKAQARLDSVNFSIARLRGLAGTNPSATSETQNSLRGSLETLPLPGLLEDLRRIPVPGLRPNDRLADSQAAASTSAEGYRTAQIEVIDSEIQIKQAELEGIMLEREKTEEELVIIARQLADYKTAYETGAISRRELDAIAREKLTLERELGRHESRIAAARAAMIQAGARKAELLAKLKHESLLDVTSLETERTETEALIRQLEDRLARQRLTSPVSGIVHVVNVHEKGDIVSPADVVVEVVPEDGKVFVQVEIPAEKVGDVHVGMDASVKILTYDFARFGAIDAVVERISPTSVLTEEGQSVFKVDLSLASSHVGPETANRVVNPGMTVIADVKAGTKTVFHYLLRPLRVLSDRAMTES